MQTPEQQKRFFDTFGYLVLPGLVKDDISWIMDEFEAVFADRGVQHDATRRTTVVPFIDQRERLCTLLDHPALAPVIKNLLGDDFNYVGGDGNYYTGDTNWHSDGYHDIGCFIKAAFYLDPVARDTGALRVIPGSHLIPVRDVWRENDAARAPDLFGIEGRDVPAIALESTPGDVVFFNHNLRHAAFGGGSRRRMFTLNLCRQCETPEEIADLEDYVASHDRLWIDSMHSQTMRETGPPERQRHLQQVWEHEGHLPALSAKARERMPEASRH